MFGEGLRDYSLDDDMIFYPIYLTEAITLAAVETRLAVGDFGIVLQMTIHSSNKEMLENTPCRSIAHVVRSVGAEQLEKLMPKSREKLVGWHHPLKRKIS